MFDYIFICQTTGRRKTFTFAFPRFGSSNFKCTRDRSCPAIPEPPRCPNGFSSFHEGAACGVSCREIVGYTYRCQCRNWKECAVKQSYAIGCAESYYASYRVRECIQGIGNIIIPTRLTKFFAYLCYSFFSGKTWTMP